MTEAERATLRLMVEALGATIRTLTAEREAVVRLLELDGAPDLGPSLVPLAQAAQAWGCTKEAARKRAVRGAGVKVNGRLFVPASSLPQCRRGSTL